MDVGILGLAGSGKTTLFSLLTANADALAARAQRREATVGMGSVPDPRLDLLSDLYRPRKTTPAVVRYVDVPGIEGEHRSESSLNIPELRTMDALLVVLRAFTDDAVPHPLGSPDPLRDLERIEEELLLQDQMVVERRLERLDKDLARRKVPTLAAEQKLLQRCLAGLEDGRPLRAQSLTRDEKDRLRGFTFLSLKPILAVVNVDEDAVGDDPSADRRWHEWLQGPATRCTTVCATLEREISELEPEDAAAFMADLGIADRALDRIARSAYALLGLISFFTVGEDECRAWSVPRETPAVEAAGAIHSDISRGFIRAEVVPHVDLLELGSLTACRDRGTLRLEGKTYPVQDGDVVHYRFNV
jgi:GTP-binding protein YchF